MRIIIVLITTLSVLCANAQTIPTYHVIPSSGGSGGGGGGSTSTLDNIDPFGDGSGVCLVRLNGDLTTQKNISGNTAPASSTGGTLTYQSGQFPGTQAAKFDGAVMVDINIDNSLSSNGSVSFWFYVDQAYSSGDAGPFLGHYNVSNGFRTFVIGANNNAIATNASATNGDYFYWRPLASDINTITAGWHHLVTHREVGGDYVMYIDNAKYVCETNIAPQTVNIDLIFGKRLADNTRGFLGRVQQVRIFNRALSDSEVGILNVENI